MRRSFLSSLPVFILVSVSLESGCNDCGASGNGSGKSHLRKQRDLLMDRIVKTAETVTYPPDNFWKTVQKRIPLNEPFPCENAPNRPRWRSERRPESVHQLRPGDIDVIGAMGDSLTCGNGAREFNPIGIAIQDRGVSFTGGGIGTWREIITLPNILKNFNPKLVGYSLGRGDFGSYNAQLNVAIPASLDDDALTQAKLFVSKMLRDPRINITSDWKMLSILIGHNDLCSYHCYSSYEMHSPEAHKFQLQKALDYLYAKVPRLFVNIISVIDTSITARVKRTPFCDIVNAIACSCLFRSGDLKKGLIQISNLAMKYQEAERELAFSERYSGRGDFTVEWQPFLQFFNGRKANGFLIRSLNAYVLWSSDCIHFNQKGMGLTGTMLWNNILEPPGNKSSTFHDYSIQDIKCPTKKATYIFTKENSKLYYDDGQQ